VRAPMAAHVSQRACRSHCCIPRQTRHCNADLNRFLNSLGVGLCNRRQVAEVPGDGIVPEESWTPILSNGFVAPRAASAQFSRSCWYNTGMTLMEITYELQSPLQPEQLRALGSFANTYGLRRFRVDEQTNRLSFEYDASRLKETEVEHVLRQARIPVTRRVEPVGTVSQT
jgi:hypothetical protein